MIIPNIWENKKCSKPPTSIDPQAMRWFQVPVAVPRGIGSFLRHRQQYDAYHGASVFMGNDETDRGTSTDLKMDLSLFHCHFRLFQLWFNCWTFESDPSTTSTLESWISMLPKMTPPPCDPAKEQRKIRFMRKAMRQVNWYLITRKIFAKWAWLSCHVQGYV